MIAPSQTPCVNSIPALSRASATRRASSLGAGPRMLTLVPKSYWAGSQCIPGVMIDRDGAGFGQRNVEQITGSIPEDRKCRRSLHADATVNVSLTASVKQIFYC